MTRNRIRLELLPLLNEFNPKIVKILTQLGNQSEEAYHDQLMIAEFNLKHCLLPSAQGMRILSKAKLKELRDWQIKTLFRLLWQKENWPMTNMFYAHWERIVDIVRKNIPAIDFPDGIRIKSGPMVIQIGKR